MLLKKVLLNFTPSEIIVKSDLVNGLFRISINILFAKDKPIQIIEYNDVKNILLLKNSNNTPMDINTEVFNISLSKISKYFNESLLAIKSGCIEIGFK